MKKGISFHPIRTLKASVRYKLFIQEALMICLFALLIMVVNIFFLEKFYVLTERSMLTHQAAYIDSLAITDYSAAALDLERIEKINNAMITVYRPVGSHAFVLYHTNINFSQGMPDAERFSALSGEVLEEHIYKDGSVYQRQKDPRMNVEYLVCIRRLSNGDILDIRVIKNSVRRSVQLANRFLLYITLAALIGLLIRAYRYSRRFSRPIEEMNDITRAITNLDFTRKCRADSDDEVGQLARSINELSDSLGNALNDLQNKNELLRRDIERKEKAEALRKEFISGVSHELKTPLSIIMGYAEGLQMDVSDPEKRHAYADVISQEAQKMNKMVHSLLQLSRMESGQDTPDLTRFSATGLIREVLDKYEPIFADEQVRLVSELDSDAMIEGDRMRLEQALTNYLNNALAHADGERIVRVRGERTDDRYRISVYNTGAAIPPDELDNLWDSFYRGDKARCREQGRYGLGLAIVRAVMDLHKGTCGVHNIEGGVEFTLEIPCATDPPAEGTN